MDFYRVLVSFDSLIDYLRDIRTRKIQVKGLSDGSEAFKFLFVAPNPLLAVPTFELFQNFGAASKKVLLALGSLYGWLLVLNCYWILVRHHILI